MCPAWGGLSAILNKSNFRAWVFLRYIHFKTSISAPLKFQKTSEGITSKSEEKGRAVGIFHSWWGRATRAEESMTFLQAFQHGGDRRPRHGIAGRGDTLEGSPWTLAWRKRLGRRAIFYGATTGGWRAISKQGDELYGPPRAVDLVVRCLWGSGKMPLSGI